MMARRLNRSIQNIKDKSMIANLSTISLKFQPNKQYYHSSQKLYRAVSSNTILYSTSHNIESLKLQHEKCNKIIQTKTHTHAVKATSLRTLKKIEKIYVTLKVKRRKVKVKTKMKRLACSIKSLKQQQQQQQQQQHHQQQKQSSSELLHQSYLNMVNLSYKYLTQIPLTQWLWLLFCFSSLTQNSLADCPNVCECKWKSGKESVLCLNANLTYIPSPLDPGTQVLDLTGNDIITIPDDAFAVIKLLNLQKIFLAKCRLNNIEPYALRGLINLVELDLSYNSLLNIPSEAFKWITELRELKLNGNPLNGIDSNAFSEMKRLVRLELSDCFITKLDERAFAGLENSLEYLKLDGNRLSNIRSDTITSLTNLHGISLSRNHWNCSCALRPLRAWMLRENIPCGIPPICKTPERLAGKTWNKIDLDDFACVPQIIATDAIAHGVEGRNITMTCYVKGVPEPSIHWLIKNRIIANLTAHANVNDDQITTNSPRMAATTQGRKTYVVNMLRNASNLTILTADMQDAGIYTCAAENKAGKVEASVTLAVSRRPPEAPLSFIMILLCMLIALVFVGGSCVAAVCFCSLRRKRKLRLWNNVLPQDRIDNYEKIEMTSHIHHHHHNHQRSVGDGVGSLSEGGKQDFGRKAIVNREDGSISGNKSVTSHFFHNDENGYLCTATTPLNCSSNDMGDTGEAIINPSSGGSGGIGAGSGSLKRNGDYRKVSTHCDDDDLHENSLINDNKKCLQQQQTPHQHQQHHRHQQQQHKESGGIDYYRNLFVTSNTSHADKVNCSIGGGDTTCGNNNLLSGTTTTITTNKNTLSDGRWKNDGSGNGGTTISQNYQDNTRVNNNTTQLCKIESTDNTAPLDSLKILDDTDLHIPRLIDIGSITESCSHSISGKLDNNDRAGQTYNHIANWINKSITSSKGMPDKMAAATTDYYTVKNEVRKSVLCDNNTSDNDLFDSNYPDLLDIAKYAVAQATSSSQANGGLCTLPRRLKHSGKYYKNSSDSQSPLLADNSSKYGSSTLSDAAYLNDIALGRRFSAESTFSAYPHNTLTYSKGQRSNSYLNLVHSTNNKSGLTAKTTTLTAATNNNETIPRRNPSLPSSPIHDQTNQQQQQHQRSFSSAATPLLDFSTLTTRIGKPGGGAKGNGGSKSNTATTNGPLSTLSMSNSVTSTPVTAYDYHAAQLERFLEEYRSLQNQLCKMKETCETIRKKEVPLRGSLGHAAHAADPVMYNAALVAAHSPTSNPKITSLKSKTTLPGQPPDPPPYWLHRNAMLKRLNESQNDIFKS